MAGDVFSFNFNFLALVVVFKVVVSVVLIICAETGGVSLKRVGQGMAKYRYIC